MFVVLKGTNPETRLRIMRFTTEINDLAHSLKTLRGWSWSKCLRQAIKAIRREATKAAQMIAFMFAGKVSVSFLSRVSGSTEEHCSEIIAKVTREKVKVGNSTVYVPSKWCA